jgi:predicted transcriptional regulator
MQKLTKAEEQVMQAVWKIEKGFLKDLMEALPEPKPAQSTLSTLIRILEGKGFLAHRSYGKNHEYYALIPKDEYLRFYMQSVLSTYFDGSVRQLLSFFQRSGSLSLEELDEVMKKIGPEPPDQPAQP